MTEAGEDDASLIDAIVTRRSERAARMLVDRHSPRLLTIVRRLLASDASAAEDVLQQSWVSGIAALPTFRRESAFSTWMTRIAIHATFDHLRRRSVFRDDASDDELVAIAVASDGIDHRLDLERGIAQLPSGCRGVLVLHDIEGFTHEEIAESLGIAVGTSKAHLFRARRLLRRWLTNDTDKEAMP